MYSLDDGMATVYMPDDNQSCMQHAPEPRDDAPGRHALMTHPVSVTLHASNQPAGRIGDRAWARLLILRGGGVGCRRGRRGRDHDHGAPVRPPAGNMPLPAGQELPACRRGTTGSL